MQAKLRVTSLWLVIGLPFCFNACGGGNSTGSPGSGTGSQRTISSITIAPNDLNVGQQQQLVATATYSNGSTGSISPETWSSSNTQVLTVSPAGLATGIAHGQSTVSASFSGVVGSAALQVHGGALNITITGSVTGTVAVTGAGGYAATVVGNQTLQVAPGTYAIAGNPTTSGNSTYWPSVQSQSVTVPDGASASATVDYSTIIPNTTKVLDAAGINSLVVSSDGSTIAISSSSAVATSLNVGDVLAIAPCTAAPSGLLLRILAVSTSGTTITASTQRAALTDAIQQATVHFTQTIGPQNLTANSRKLLAKHRSSGAADLSANPAASTGACAGNSNTIQLPYSMALVQDSSGTLSLSGENDLCAALQLDFQIGFFKLVSLDSTLNGGIHTSTVLSDSVKGSVSKTIDLRSLQATTIPVFIGNVPIGLTPTLTPFVGASGSADATISTGVTTDTTIKLGVSYANGVWTPVDTAPSPTSVSSTTSADANASLKAFAGLRAGISISSTLVPGAHADVSASADGYLQLKAGLNQNPCWTLDGGLEGSAGLAATVFGQTANFSTDPLNLYNAHVDQAKGPCNTVTVTPENSTVNVDETVQLTASEVDLLGNPVTAQFDWASSVPSVATIDQNGLVTSVAGGTATITATDTTTMASGNATIMVTGAPTYFLSGNWTGTATVVEQGETSTYDVAAAITQTDKLLSATLTVLAAGNVPVMYTINGQINGSSISFDVADNDDPSSSTEIADSATGTISSNGLQVSGSGADGSTGIMSWDGEQTLSGSATIAANSVDNGGGDIVTWSFTVNTDGQHLTGGATSPTGDSVTWTFTRQ